MTEPANPASALRVEYPDGRVVSIDGLPFRVEVGERVALLGPNGSGKSTLLRAILGLVRPAAGEVRVFGKDPARQFDQIRRRVGAVLQDVEAQLLAPTVGEDLAFGLDRAELSAAEITRRVQEMAECCNLTRVLAKVPHYLSGGERRKVALAGALVPTPDLLVLDEPFASMDPRSRAELVRHIKEEHEERGLAVLLTTHEIEELPRLVDTIYVLSDEGSLVARGSPDEIFTQHEMLASSNIAPPVMSRFLAALRARGLDLPPSYDVDEVADALVAIPRFGRRKHDSTD
jgi:cobalt/nickel transport system ATP-binding protein